MPRGGKRPGAGRRRTRPLPQPPAPTPTPLETLKPEVTPHVAADTGKDKLTPKERFFVEEYLVDLNASAAYLRAGYKGKNQYARASELRSKPKIAAAIDRALAARAKRVHVDQDRVLTELARIAFADRRKLFERREGGITAERLYDACRNADWTLPFNQLQASEQNAWTEAAARMNAANADGFCLKDPDQLDDDLAAAFEGVEVTTKSLGGGEVEHVKKVLTTGKIPALTLIGKHLGMWHEKGSGGGNPRDVEVDEHATDAELLERAEALLSKARGRLTSAALEAEHR